MLLTAIESFQTYFLQYGTIIVSPQIWLTLSPWTPVYLRVISNEPWQRAASLFTQGEEMRVRQVCVLQKVSSSEREQRPSRECWDCLLWWFLGLNCSSRHYYSQLEMSFSTNFSWRQFGKLPSRKGEVVWGQTIRKRIEIQLNIL